MLSSTVTVGGLLLMFSWITSKATSCAECDNFHGKGRQVWEEICAQEDIQCVHDEDESILQLLTSAS